MINEVDETQSSPLMKVLDLAAVVLLSAVVVRAVGGIVAAVGIPALKFTAPSGLGVIGFENLYTFPTYVRFQYGTGWADVVSGLLLLAAVGLVALPRMVWNVNGNDSFRISPWLPLAGGSLAVLAAAAGVIDAVNVGWNIPRIDSSTEALDIAAAAAAVILSVLAATLWWLAHPFARPRRGTSSQP